MSRALKEISCAVLWLKAAAGGVEGAWTQKVWVSSKLQ